MYSSRQDLEASQAAPKSRVSGEDKWIGPEGGTLNKLSQSEGTYLCKPL